MSGSRWWAMSVGLHTPHLDCPLSTSHVAVDSATAFSTAFPPLPPCPHHHITSPPLHHALLPRLLFPINSRPATLHAYSDAAHSLVTRRSSLHFPLPLPSLPHSPLLSSMVKRNNKVHRKQTKSELLRKKKSSHTAFQHQSDFVHPSIKAAWDPRRTLRQNYVALGLAADPNDRKQRQRQSERLPQIDIDATEEELQQSLKGKKRKRADIGEEQRVEGDTTGDVDGADEEEEDEEGVAEVELTPAAQQLHAELLEMERIGKVAPKYEVKVSSAALPWPRPSHPLNSRLTLRTAPPFFLPSSVLCVCVVDVVE